MGNAGAGKTTMARGLLRRKRVPRLSLDEIAWSVGTRRKPLGESVRELEAFMDRHDGWIVEGCYGDLLEVAVARCTELRFLNPGVEACVANCLERPWEPEKFASREEQADMLRALLDWVRQYEVRDDEYGLARHRRIFDAFAGRKREYASLFEYDGAWPASRRPPGAAG